MLLGETAEARGFKLKPAKPQPVGMSQDEEFWNTYQSVQEQLSGNTHKDAEPVCVVGEGELKCLICLFLFEKQSKFLQ